MIGSRVNLQKELENIRGKEISEKEILEEIKAFLAEKERSDEDILERLNSADGSEENPFNLDLLETNRIFHISHIKKMCADYRLRFLSTKYFKGELPEAAFSEIRKLEKEHQISLSGFKIMAPAKLFKLENADDPILFAPIGNKYFYLIHKWGNDLHSMRKLFMWPLKSPENLLVFSVGFSFLFTFVIRELFFSSYRETSQFLMLFLFTFKSVAGLILFYGIALGKNFSSSVWRSKYYNA